jgi:ATP-dependent Clp protease ATP-binding subunit ClpA
LPPPSPPPGPLAGAVASRFEKKTHPSPPNPNHHSQPNPPKKTGHNFVGTEQILLGLIGESTGIAAKVLKSMGVNLKDARVEVEKIIGRGSGFVAVEIPFTPRAKRVLELSLEEARQLGEFCSRLALV